MPLQVKAMHFVLDRGNSTCLDHLYGYQVRCHVAQMCYHIMCQKEMNFL